jgi:hypothetical protein
MPVADVLGPSQPPTPAGPPIGGYRCGASRGRTSRISDPGPWRQQVSVLDDPVQRARMRIMDRLVLAHPHPVRPAELRDAFTEKTGAQELVTSLIADGLVTDDDGLHLSRAAREMARLHDWLP